jgi:hypothetical protein
MGFMVLVRGGIPNMLTIAVRLVNTNGAIQFGVR